MANDGGVAIQWSQLFYVIIHQSHVDFWGDGSLVHPVMSSFPFYKEEEDTEG